MLFLKFATKLSWSLFLSKKHRSTPQRRSSSRSWSLRRLFTTCYIVRILALRGSVISITQSPCFFQHSDAVCRGGITDNATPPLFPRGLALANKPSSLLLLLPSTRVGKLMAIRGHSLRVFLGVIKYVRNRSVWRVVRLGNYFARFIRESFNHSEFWMESLQLKKEEERKQEKGKGSDKCYRALNRLTRRKYCASRIYIYAIISEELYCNGGNDESIDLSGRIRPCFVSFLIDRWDKWTISRSVSV